MLKQVSGPLQLASPIAFDELHEIRVPDVIHVRPLKHAHTSLISLKSFLKVVILLQEHAKVDDYLRSGNLKVKNTVIHSFSGLQGRRVMGGNREIGKAMNEPHVHRLVKKTVVTRREVLPSSMNSKLCNNVQPL